MIQDLKDAWPVTLTGLISLPLLAWMLTYPPDWAEPIWPGSGNKDDIQAFLGQEDDFRVTPVEAKKQKSPEQLAAQIKEQFGDLQFKVIETTDGVSVKYKKWRLYEFRTDGRIGIMAHFVFERTGDEWPRTIMFRFEHPEGWTGNVIWAEYVDSPWVSLRDTEAGTLGAVWRDFEHDTKAFSVNYLLKRRETEK